MHGWWCCFGRHSVCYGYGAGCSLWVTVMYGHTVGCAFVCLHVLHEPAPAPFSRNGPISLRHHRRSLLTLIQHGAHSAHSATAAHVTPGQTSLLSKHYITTPFCLLYGVRIADRNTTLAAASADFCGVCCGSLSPQLLPQLLLRRGRRP